MITGIMCHGGDVWLSGTIKVSTLVDKAESCKNEDEGKWSSKDLMHLRQSHNFLAAMAVLFVALGNDKCTSEYIQKAVMQTARI